MKKNILTLILLLGVGLTFAQTPGFQGKKCIIKYDFGIMHPIIVGRSGKLPMAYHNLSFDYTVSRAWTVGGKYGFMTYNAPPDRKSFFNTEGGYYYGEYDGLEPRDFKGRYTQHVVSFIAKKYYKRKGFIAPVGRYIILGLYYQHTTQHIATLENTYDPVSGYYIESLKGHKATTHFVGVTVGIGRNFVVAKRMIIDVSFNLNLTPPPKEIVLGNSNIKSAAYRDLLLRNLFQINLGLGALAF